MESAGGPHEGRIRGGRLNSCPLCGSPEVRLFHHDPKRDFFRCARCSLTFVPAPQHVRPEDELRRYLEHHNDPLDPGYREFFAPLVREIALKASPGSEGLDFGSGHDSALPLVLRERGFRVETYDPFFDPDQAKLGRLYDFVVAAEVFEHLARPGDSWKQVRQLLKPAGILGLMSLWLPSDKDFPSWWYKNDPTHIAFYKEETLRWMAKAVGLRLEIRGPRLALFRPEGGQGTGG